MMNHYKNIISIVYLLFCLFITSASALSYIRRFTDGGNTNIQENNGAVPNSDLDKAYNLRNHQEVSSRDYKVSVSSMVKGFRTRPPSSYSLNMESLNLLLNSFAGGRYESRPFSAVGYNWTLVVYPYGNKKDGGADQLSLYVAIDKSALVVAHQEVFVDLRFYIFNKKEKKFFTIQDTDVWRYSVFQTVWGFSQVLPVNEFRDQTQGYVYDGDHCEFGVDVTLPPLFEKSELFSVAEINEKNTWNLRGFSTLLKDVYYSDVFSIGRKNWNIRVYPSGIVSGKGKALSMFLALSANEKLKPYEKIYVRAKLRVLNQRKLTNIEYKYDAWYNSGDGYGTFELISFSDLKDSSKGFVVNDVLTVEAEIEALSSTKYFP